MQYQPKLVKGDCLSYMRDHMEDDSVDLIVTDPPYEFEDMTSYFEEMKRVLKSNGSLYCFGDKNMIAENWFRQLKMPSKDLLVWHYRNSPKPKGRWRLSMQGLIYAHFGNPKFYQDRVRVEYTESAKKLNGRQRPSSGRMKKSKPYDTSKGALPRDVIDVPALLGHLARERVGHRDQKPLKLINKLILASSDEGELVFDPFAGSGTTLVASQALKRDSIGVELLPKHVTMITGRVECEILEGKP